MTPKQLLLFTIILVTTSSMTYTMQTCPRECIIKTEKSFQERVNHLKSPEIRKFVEDFKTWPKEEKDKLSTSCGGQNRQYCVYPNHADHKFDGHVGKYLQKHLTDNDAASFYAMITYLKNKK